VERHGSSPCSNPLLVPIVSIFAQYFAKLHILHSHLLRGLCVGFQDVKQFTGFQPCSVPHFLVRKSLAVTIVQALRPGFEPRPCGICDGQIGSGVGFLRVLQFPLPILISPTAPRSSSVIQGCYNRPISGRRTKWTQFHPTPRNLKKLGNI
jgi:hypothetical protein